VGFLEIAAMNEEEQICNFKDIPLVIVNGDGDGVARSV
jgi:hypothetical protein